MSYIKSRKHAVPRSTGPITSMAAMTMLSLASTQAVAQSSDTEPRTSGTLGEVTVRDSADTYKADTVSSPKYTAPLLDTPQTINVLPAKVLEEQKSLSLQEALTNNIPGITFQAGEGGGGYGDNIVFRGFSATDSISQDGMRDSGMYTRSDFFNTEELTVTNGASSVYGGAGNVGGSIDLVSKQPKNTDFTTVSGGLGNAKYGRATVDMNRRATDSVAWRLNAMVHRNNIAERDEERFKRWGFAPSVKFGINTPTQVTLSYFYQKDDNIPQYGVPYANTPFNNGPIAGIARNNYYAYRNTGVAEELDNHRFSAVVDHRIDENMSVRNLTRLGQTDRYSLVDAIRGTWCVNGANPYGLTAEERVCTIADNTFLPNSGPHGYVRDENNRIISNQTDLKMKLDAAGMQHDVVVGLALSHETYDRTTGSVLNNADGTSVEADARTPMSATNPQGIWNGPVNYFSSGINEGKFSSMALYAFDNIKFNDQWSFNGGIRFEHVRGESQATQAVRARRVQVGEWGPKLKNSDNLFSFRGGVVYKPVEHGSVYAALGNSKTPSQASVRGSCNANNCNVDPETALNYELGTKWDLMDRQLSLTAAMFRNERTNYKVESGDPLAPQVQLDGKSRVDGLALGVTGAVMPGWNMYANYAYLKSKVLQDVSDHIRNTTGIDARAGNPLTHTPKHSFNFWTNYQVGAGWEVGYGFNYVGRMYLNNQAGPLYQSDAYTVHNAMVGYRVNKDLNIQLNAKNLTNKEYYTRIRGAAASRFAVPGTGRTVILSADYSF